LSGGQGRPEAVREEGQHWEEVDRALGGGVKASMHANEYITKSALGGEVRLELRRTD